MTRRDASTPGDLAKAGANCLDQEQYSTEPHALHRRQRLPVLRGLDSEIIDLAIATDPPFNKGVRAFEGATKASVDIEYKGVWYWGDVQEK